MGSAPTTKRLMTKSTAYIRGILKHIIEAQAFIQANPQSDKVGMHKVAIMNHQQELVEMDKGQWSDFINLSELLGTTYPSIMLTQCDYLCGDATIQRFFSNTTGNTWVEVNGLVVGSWKLSQY